MSIRKNVMIAALAAAGLLGVNSLHAAPKKAKEARAPAPVTQTASDLDTVNFEYQNNPNLDLKLLPSQQEEFKDYMMRQFASPNGNTSTSSTNVPQIYVPKGFGRIYAGVDMLDERTTYTNGLGKETTVATRGMPSVLEADLTVGAENDELFGGINYVMRLDSFNSLETKDKEKVIQSTTGGNLKLGAGIVQGYLVQNVDGFWRVLGTLGVQFRNTQLESKYPQNVGILEQGLTAGFYTKAEGQYFKDGKRFASLGLKLERQDGLRNYYVVVPGFPRSSRSNSINEIAYMLDGNLYLDHLGLDGRIIREQFTGETGETIRHGLGAGLTLYPLNWIGLDSSKSVGLRFGVLGQLGTDNTTSRNKLEGQKYTVGIEYNGELFSGRK